MVHLSFIGIARNLLGLLCLSLLYTDALGHTHHRHRSRELARAKAKQQQLARHRAHHHASPRQRVQRIQDEGLLQVHEASSVFQAWSAWSRCSQTCQQRRSRQCKEGRQCNTSALKQRRTCPNCRSSMNIRRSSRFLGLDSEMVVDVLYHEWTTWGPCTRSCKKRRFRTCAVKWFCKHPVIHEEKNCYAPGTKCERRYLLNPDFIAEDDDNDNWDDAHYEQDLDYKPDKEQGKGKGKGDKSEEKHNKPKKPNRKKHTPKPSRHTTKAPEPPTKAPKPTTKSPKPTKVPSSNDTETTELLSTEPEEEDNYTSTAQPVTPMTMLNAATCGIRNISASPRIVGGYDSVRGKWPWLVGIMNKWHEHYCGGVLVAPQWVVTAAHCVRRNGRRRRVLVRVGEHDLTVNNNIEATHKVTTDFVHPNFTMETIDSDIALVKLKTPVDLSKYVSFTCLPEPTDHIPPNTLCYVMGWGKLKDTHLFGTDVLQEAGIPLVGRQKCQDAFEYEITANQLCAGYKRGGVDSCAGDSGGPLMCQIDKDGDKRWYIYGITSFGEGCGDKGKYGIYTKVNNYIDWIHDIISAN